MKKSIKVFLSICICLLVVGSGFSAWYFSTLEGTTSTSTATGSISVTPIVGSFDATFEVLKGEDVIFTGNGEATPTALDALNITLDQGEVTNPAQLIYFGNDTSATTLTLTVRLTIEADKTENEANDALTIGKINGLVPTVTLTKTLGTKLEEYIDFTDATVLSAPTNTNAQRIADSDKLTRVIEYTLPISFEYVAKPSNPTEYAEMVADVASEVYNLAFTVAYAE